MGLFTRSQPTRATPLKRQVSARQPKAPQADSSDSEDDLPELASDSAVLYERGCAAEYALGTTSELALHHQITAYVQQRYFHGLGLSHQAEPLPTQVRTVPFDAKAPRFISIHAIRRKELERDYTEPPDTAASCHRKHNCLGRCLLGFPCPPT